MEHSPSWEANRFTASQEIPHILWTPMFINAFTSARHLSLTWANSIQSIPLHSTSWRSILILSSHLRLALPNGPFPQVSPPKSCSHVFSPPYVLHTPPISFFPIWSPEKKLGGGTQRYILLIWISVGNSLNDKHQTMQNPFITNWCT